MERKEAIKIVRKLYNESLFLKKDKEAMITLIPELRESEDEKIRKCLINQYKGDGCLCGNNFRISYEDIRAWLEKQDEQKLLDNVAKQVTKDKETATSFLKSTGIMNENGELAEPYRVCESTSNWSEGDEEKRESIEDRVNNFFDALGDCGYMQDEILRFKSLWKQAGLLQPQSTWKPSEEQIDAFYIYLYQPQYIDNSDDEKIKLVESLYNDLKKLREE